MVIYCYTLHILWGTNTEKIVYLVREMFLGFCLSAISRASFLAAPNNSFGGKIPSMSPDFNACLSLMGLLVSIIWIACSRPTSLGRRCVPPNPGIIPRDNSGRPKLVPKNRKRKQSIFTQEALLSRLFTQGSEKYFLHPPIKYSQNQILNISFWSLDLHRYIMLWEEEPLKLASMWRMFRANFLLSFDCVCLAPLFKFQISLT